MDPALHGGWRKCLLDSGVGADPGGVPEVLCGETELQEYGEVIAIGNRIERRAGRRSEDSYGAELDRVTWAFDRYVEYTGAEKALIRGDVVRIETVFVFLTKTPGRSNAVPRRLLTPRAAPSDAATTWSTRGTRTCNLRSSPDDDSPTLY